MRNALDTGAPLLVLSARLETLAAKTGLLAVTSALPGDGKSVTATDLARTFAQAGHRTLLADANERHHELPPDFRLRRASVLQHTDPPRMENDVDHLFGVSLWGDGDSAFAAPDAISELCAIFQSRFRFTIIDCAPLPSSRIAQMFAAEAEAVVVTVREGRPQRRDDVLLTQLLNARESRVAGIVTTSHAARQRFAHYRREVAQRPPARLTSLAGVPS
jgi:succinoglycan biosynthesis transport protein ExoP